MAPGDLLLRHRRGRPGHAEAWWETESAKVDKRRGPRRTKEQPSADIGDVV